MFSPNRRSVALIEKKYPAWQAGRLNGIGGKFESGETTYDAIAREFWEEAGVETNADDWEKFVILEGPDFVVHFFRAFSRKVYDISSMTAEVVGVHEVDPLPYFVTPNLRWLIPLALHENLVLPVHVQETTDEACLSAHCWR